MFYEPPDYFLHFLLFPAAGIERILGRQLDFQPIQLCIFFVPGLALLIAARLLDGRCPAARSTPSRLFLTAGMTLFVLAALALLICSTAAFAIVAGPILAVLLIGVYVRRRRGEDHALLSGLAIAAEEGIQLVDTARAFAAERGDARTALVWRSLAAGQPLRIALARGGVQTPAAAGAVLSFAEERGCLGSLLRRGLEPLRSLDSALTLLLNRFLQWQFSLAVWAAVMLFLILKILPVIEAIAKDASRYYFNPIDVPAWTMAPLELARDTVWRPRICAVLAATLVLPLIFVALRQSGVRLMFRGRPYLRWLRLRYDSAVILHALAAGVRSAIALPELLRAIADAQEIPFLRRRLGQVAEDVRRGGETWEAFRRAGLLAASEAASLRAADRCGNTAFALDEISQAIIRRLEYRLRSGTAILYPVGLAILGSLVTFTAVLLFIPMVAWIYRLS